MISYALDLDLEIVLTRTDLPKQLAGLQIENGMVEVTYQVARTSEYFVNSEAKKQKQLIIEQPIDGDLELQTREALEEATQDLYRFGVDVTPGATILFVVKELKKLQEKTPLDGLDAATIMSYQSKQAVSDSAKKILSQLVAMRHELTRVSAALLQNSDQVRDVTNWQSRMLTT